MEEDLNSVRVHRGIEKRAKLLGVEFVDMVIVFATAVVMNLFFADTPLQVWAVYVLPAVIGGALIVGKRGRPENHLIHLLRHRLTPGRHSAGAEGKGEGLRKGVGGPTQEGGKESALADRLPWWYFDGDTAVFDDGSLGVGFSIRGIDTAHVSAGELNTLSERLEDALKSAAAGLRLQIFYRMTSDASGIIRRHGEISKDCEGVSRIIHDARLAHMKGRKWRVPRIYFFIRSRPPGVVGGFFRGLFRGRKRFESELGGELDGRRLEFFKEVDTIEGGLVRAGLNPARIGGEEWFRLIGEYLNPGRAELLPPPKLRDHADPFSPSLASQLSLTDLYDSPEGVRLGRHRIRTVSLATLPEGATFPGMAEGCLGFSFDFIAVQNIEIPGQAAELDRLRASRRIAASLAAGAAHVSDLESESRLGKLEEIVSEVMEGREKVVRSDLNIIIREENGRDDRCGDVLAAFAGMNRAEGLVETVAGLDAFLSNMPGVCEGFRMKRMKSGNCAHLMPVYGRGGSDGNPVCLLEDGRNSFPQTFDPFDRRSDNFNALVFGGSGSGKSFTVLQLMMMFSGQRPRPKIIWLDNGASSKRLMEAADGRFVELALESGVRLNLFDLSSGESEPSPSKMKLLLAALEIMLTEGDGRTLGKLETAQLEEALLKVYRETDGVPTLGDFKNVLNGHEEPGMREYAKILYSWTGDRPYGRMLDGGTNIDLESDLVTVEIKGLDDHPDLQRIMLLAFTGYIRSAAKAGAGRRTLLIVDEAWRLFSGGAGREFSIEAYRTFRKFGGGAGIWCVSQNYRDFLADRELGDALLPNTANIFVLKQRGIDWRDLQERLQLSGRELETVKGLEVEKGGYANFFLMKGAKRSLMRLVPDPLSYWIATTDADDVRRIEERKRDNPELSILEILEGLAGEGG